MKYVKILILSLYFFMLMNNFAGGKGIPSIVLLLLTEQTSLTGTWHFYLNAIGSEEEGPFELGIVQEGSNFSLCEGDSFYNGSMDGKNISIDLPLGQFVGTVLNSYLIQGTYPSGTWRMVKISETTICIEIEPWDIDAKGIPKFVSSDHIELSKISAISKFRSASGHDFSDDFESCRSMKHYYVPFQELDWSQIKIYSPVNGTLLKIEQEYTPNSGMLVYIRSTKYPAFTFRIFHVNVNEKFSVGGSVAAGEEIGTHISNITTDDIAVGVTTPQGWKLVSFFNVMTDSLFQDYQNRGAQSRDDFIISKEARDADSLTCSGETFITSGTIENTVYLTH